MLRVSAVALAPLLTLSQCRVVPDSVTGVDIASGRLSGRSTCVKACNETFKAAMQAEEEAYRAADKACGQDKQCRDAVKDAHKARQAQINDDKNTCKKGCYNEGGGDGGR